MITRAIVIVLDSVGIGELSDAAEYGDAGCNTLAHVAGPASPPPCHPDLDSVSTTPQAAIYVIPESPYYVPS